MAREEGCQQGKDTCSRLALGKHGALLVVRENERQHTQGAWAAPCWSGFLRPVHSASKLRIKMMYARQAYGPRPRRWLR